MTSYSSVTGFIHTLFLQLYTKYDHLSLSVTSPHIYRLCSKQILYLPNKKVRPRSSAQQPPKIFLTAQARKYLTSNRDTNDLGLKSILVTNSRLNLARILDHYFSHLNGFFIFSARTGNPEHLSLCSKPFQKKREQKRTKIKMKRKNNNKKRKKVP